jgi:phosphatidate cytidylyltransferase
MGYVGDADAVLPGFVFFVATLEKGHYRFQFTQFAWTHMALYLIVVQAHFVMNNVFEGMIWFLLPATLVITNDTMAYIVGITFGRTQLIELSPKKTVEGFVGAWIFTVIAGVLVTSFLIRYPYFICPVNVGRRLPSLPLPKGADGLANLSRAHRTWAQIS